MKSWFPMPPAPPEFTDKVVPPLPLPTMTIIPIIPIMTILYKHTTTITISIANIVIIIMQDVVMHKLDG